MHLTIDRVNDVAVVRVGDARLMYPMLSEFSTTVTDLLAAGARRVLVDL